MLHSHMPKCGNIVWFHNGKRKPFLALEKTSSFVKRAERKSYRAIFQQRSGAHEEVTCSDISLAPAISIRHTTPHLQCHWEGTLSSMTQYSTESIYLRSCTFLSAVARFLIRVLILMGNKRMCMPSINTLHRSLHKRSCKLWHAQVEAHEYTGYQTLVSITLCVKDWYQNSDSFVIYSYDLTKGLLAQIYFCYLQFFAFG